MVSARRVGDIVPALCSCIRVTTTQILAKHFWPDAVWPTQAASKWVERQKVAGMLTTRRLVIHPELGIEKALLQWTPGDPPPNFDQLSYRARARWNKEPVLRQAVMATKAAKMLHGAGNGRTPRSRELLHDISLSEVYWWMYWHYPNSASGWQFEDSIRASGREYGNAIPDAVLRKQVPGKDEVIVEFAGSYSAAKLRRLHENYKKYVYTLW